MIKDPITIGSVATGAAVSLGVTHVAGMPVEAAVWGFIGGVVAVLAVPPRNPAPRRRGLAMYAALLGSVVVSVLVAAAMGPITAAYLDLQRVSDAIELRAFSFLWGAGAQAGLLLTAIEALRRRIEQLGGCGAPGSEAAR